MRHPRAYSRISSDRFAKPTSRRPIGVRSRGALEGAEHEHRATHAPTPPPASPTPSRRPAPDARSTSPATSASAPTGRSSRAAWRAEARATFDNIERVLQAAGADFSQIVKINAFITDLDEYAAYADVRAERFGDKLPASATVEVAGLLVGAHIEIDAVAFVPESQAVAVSQAAPGMGCSKPINRYGCVCRMVAAVSEPRSARITCDIGGTFTDVVVSDESGRMTIAKALTQPANLFDGLRAALAARGRGARRAARARCSARASLFIFSHDAGDERDPRGHDRAHGVPLHRGLPRHPRAPRGRLAASVRLQPPVPRALRAAPPDARDLRADRRRRRRRRRARRAGRASRSSPARASSACRPSPSACLWSTANPAHELALGELIERELPGVPYSLSHQINPIVREYRRASGTSIDASLKPLMQRHLPEIADGLRARGLRRRAARRELRRRRRADGRADRAARCGRCARARRSRPSPRARSPTARPAAAT